MLLILVLDYHWQVLQVHPAERILLVQPLLWHLSVLQLLEEHPPLWR